MRIAALSLVGAVCLAVSAMAANAAPVVPSPVSQLGSNIVEAAGRCGWGLHPNRLGRCVPNRSGHAKPRAYRPGSYGYARPRAYRPGSYGYARPRAYSPGYYGGGYAPRYRSSPSDHVANQLNREVLRRNSYGY